MLEDYSRDITDETLKELVNFISWYNNVYGHEPLIVGGWAAWAYHGGLGSKDIDVVFPGAAAKQMTLSSYFTSNGYAEKRDVDFFDFEFAKIRKTKGKQSVEVVVDAVSLDRFVTVSGTDVRIPWGLTEKHKRKHSFGKDAEAYIVDPELLLVYKIGALAGRDYLLRTGSLSRRRHYQSKLWKDARDVLGILENCTLDSRKVHGFVDSCDLKDIIAPAFSIASSYLDTGQQKEFQRLWKQLFSNIPGPVVRRFGRYLKD